MEFECNLIIQDFVKITIPDHRIEGVLQTFRDVIQSSAEIEDVLESIAYNVVVNNATDFIEGVGDVIVVVGPKKTNPNDIRIEHGGNFDFICDSNHRRS